MLNKEIAIKNRFIKCDLSMVDFISLLNFKGKETVSHSDIDLFIILSSETQSLKSNYSLLKSFTEQFQIAFKKSHSFSTHQHQMFFQDILLSNNIRSLPFHMLVYPSLHYLFYWEIPSRIQSMKKTSVIIHQSKNWQFKEVSIAANPFHPEYFLQLLYESYIFYKLSNIRHPSITSDVLKKLEFSIKNLTYEFFLKIHGLTENFHTNWEYIFDHKEYFHQYDINTQIISDCSIIREKGFRKYLDIELEEYFQKAFIYYDELIGKIFYPPK